MSDSWDDYADEWENNAAVLTYADKAHNALQKVVNFEGQRVLDFGCGTGLLAEKVSKNANHVVALDPAEKMTAVLNQKQIANVSTIASELNQDLIEKHPLLKPQFDLIVASSSLAFVPDYAESLHLLKQLLKPGGTLVQWDWCKDEAKQGIGFSQQQLQAAFDEAGFSQVSTSLPFSIDSGDSAMQVVMGVARTT